MISVIGYPVVFQNSAIKPITFGYNWTQTINVVSNNVVFPINSTFKGHIRRDISSNIVLCTLTSNNNGITRNSNTEVIITISNTNSSNIETQFQNDSKGVVYFDIIDETNGNHTGFILKIDVQKSVTRN